MNDDVRALPRGIAKRAQRGRPRSHLPNRAIPMLLVFAMSLLVGCTGPSPREAQRDVLSRVPELNESLFGEPVPVPEFSELIAITPEQEADFRRFYVSGLNARHEPHRRVYEYLTRRLGDTEFQHRTLSASTTIDTRRGNCMSLALVTTAFARLADIEVGWQLADADPVYSSEGSVIYSAEHIQTRLYRPDFSLTSFSFAFGKPYLLVDYYTDNVPRSGRALSEAEMIALVYQNLAVEALAEGHLNESFWHLRAALEHDPANSNLYNALGVVHRRAGDERTAEALYRFALDEFGERLIILRNYRKLLLAENRVEDADRVERRIMVLPDPDPYPLLDLGDEAADQGKPDTAIAYYKRAAEIAPYLHEIYLKMAQIYTKQGDFRRAGRALREARDHAWADADQARYQAKLTALGER